MKGMWEDLHDEAEKITEKGGPKKGRGINAGTRWVTEGGGGTKGRGGKKRGFWM